MLTVSNYGIFQFFVDMELSALTCFRRLNFIKHEAYLVSGPIGIIMAQQLFI